MDGVNELYTVVNLYYLGHYQQCINEASSIQVITKDIQRNKKIRESYQATPLSKISKY